MLFRQRFWAGLADGSVTVAYRRWLRPTVKAGGTLHAAGVLLAIDAVTPVDESDITEEDARLAGFATLAELRDALRDEREDRDRRRLYRVDFHDAGPDPRHALREDAALDDAARAELDRRLARLDNASSRGPWTSTVLHVIAQSPGTRAPDLAASLGRDTLTFKTDVRKLKALGLTESLTIGYRLSPRGRAYLRLD